MSGNLLVMKRIRPFLFDIILGVILVVTSCSVLAYYLWPRSSDMLFARISVSSVSVVSDIDLSLESEERSFVIEGKEDKEITVKVKHMAICVVDVDCLSQYCTHTGWINREGQSIICLPNELVITLYGEDSSEVRI